MDVVKQNQFWFGVGGVVLLALILGGVFIGGLKSEASTLADGIRANGSRLTEFKDKAAALPTDKWAEQANADLAALTKMRDDVKNHLRAEGSKALGLWFKEMNVRPGEEPSSIDDFKPLYLRDTDALKKSLEDAGVRVGPPKKKGGFGVTTEDDGGFERIAEPTKPMMRSLMKHYWIQKRLADVVQQSKVIALLGVKFKDDPLASSKPAVPSGAPVGTGQAAAAAAAANQLPLELGGVLEFEAAIECYYPEVTTVIANFLRIDEKLPLFTRVKRVHIQKTATPKEKLEVRIPMDEADDPKWANLQPDRVPVKLILVGEVLDFAPAAK